MVFFCITGFTGIGRAGRGKKDRAKKMHSARLGILAFILTLVCPPVGHAVDPEEIILKMQKNYAKVEDYQTDVLVRRYKEDGATVVWRFTYSFKKPGMIRINFQEPHKGMIIVYSQRDGHAVVQPLPWAGFFSPHRTFGPGDR